MDVLINEFYVVDKKKYSCSLVNYQFNTNSYQFYEVLRTDQGVLLFLEDHLERLVSAVEVSGGIKKSIINEAAANLQFLVKCNQNATGNVKLVCRIASNIVSMATFYIQHNYPTPELFQTGVKLGVFHIERPDPQLKQISVSNQIAKQISDDTGIKDAYEVLLVDHNNCITEGRKSNFFLIKNNTLFTAPNESVLPGITRKYVLKIARQLNIDVRFIAVPLNEIKEYDAAFICGTSPKILPVKLVQSTSFNVTNPIMLKLMSAYNTLLNGYITDNQ